MPTPEQQARERIDAMLQEAGWAIQNMGALNPYEKLGVAVREYPTDAGPCDYMLYVGGQPCGVIEAKKVGTTLTSVEAQTAAYAKALPAAVPAPVRPLPFLYESTGADTRFTNGLDPKPRSRKVFWFHQPETLKAWIDAKVAIDQGRPGAPTAATFKGRLPQAPPLIEAGLWPPQITAVRNLEASIKKGRPRALIQMATGSGKTFTAITALYRLIKHGGARRVLFLVDRGNLGRQANTAFQGYTAPDDGRKFTSLYNVSWLQNNKIDPVNRVVITTIQRLYSILKGEPDLDEALDEGSTFFQGGVVREPPPVVYNKDIPPEFFDVVVVDEVHRSIYSLWRQVVEYFDASIIGLTATPDKRTFAFFRKNLVMEYRHEHAVRDKCNVPFQVYRIRTHIGQEGSTLVAADAPTVKVRDRQTREVRWESLDEDLTYEASALDRSVVSKDQIRTVVQELHDKLYTHIFPGRREIPKTLFFAKSDSHAEDILEVVREVFGIGNEQAVKITYKPEQIMGDDGKPKRVSASKKPEALIQAFRNSYQPRIAVTVDMIATGTDIRPLEMVVFMRSVRSRVLFEQMKGRGVRVMPDADYQALTPDNPTKTHFVLVDCVGVLDDQPVDPPVIRKPSVPLKKLLTWVAMGNREEDVLSTLAGRLDRMDRQLTPPQRAQVEQVAGGTPLAAIVAGLIDCLDPDKEDDKARALFDLPKKAKPTDEQVTAAQVELRNEGAAPVATNPVLRELLLNIRRDLDQVLDDWSLDTVTESGRVTDLEVDYAQELVDSFQQFIEDNRDEIDALQVLYAHPEGAHLTRAQIKALADTIQLPPRSWTTETLWAAYEKVEADRVRGASADRLWTDIVALAKHALGVTPDLVPFADQVEERFALWLAQQENQGRSFSEDQHRWLDLIAEQIKADAEVVVDDFDQVDRLVRAGGLVGVWEAFGDDYEQVVADLNKELVA